jgi:3-oxoacyl-[acyl-carrier protein] reductase
MNEQVILITGASRGIGRAIAVALADTGATIGIHYHTNREAAEETFSALLTSNEHFLLHGDVGDPGVCQNLIEQCLQKAGRLDALVNNAGIYTPLPFSEPDYEHWQLEWQRMFQTNFFSAVNMSYWAVQAMRVQGSGKILYISSRSGFRGEASYSHYAASKAAMINLTRSMAVELARESIQVFCIAPGWVDTDMSAEGLRAYGEQIRAGIPLERVAMPEDVAHVARFLLSDEASYLSGITVDVNGASYFH